MMKEEEEEEEEGSWYMVGCVVQCDGRRDLVYLLFDDAIVYLGRIDLQIKVRVISYPCQLPPSDDAIISKPRGEMVKMNDVTPWPLLVA